MHLKYRRTAVVVIPMFIKKTARKLVKIYNNSNIADILSPYKLPISAKLFEVLCAPKGAIFLWERMYAMMRRQILFLKLLRFITNT